MAVASRPLDPNGCYPAMPRLRRPEAVRDINAARLAVSAEEPFPPSVLERLLITLDDLYHDYCAAMDTLEAIDREPTS